MRYFYRTQLLKKAILLSLLSALSLVTLKAQVTVSPNLNATQLAQALVGPGVVVSNAVLTGSTLTANPSSGTFTAVNSNLPFSDGVVLASGYVSAIPGLPSSTANTQTCGGCSDPDLVTLSNNPIKDAVILEFDVLPIADTLKFNYIFASDEYPTFVCQQYNDVFGFFISGPGINGSYSNNSINIALIPGTTTPVGINTINQGGTSCPSNSQYYNTNTAGGNTFVYNGYTTVLQAKLVVVPCQTYRLKLKIGDAGDNQYDSGVFIQGGSLSSSGVSLSASSALGNQFSNAVEGCLNGSVTFTRTEAPNSAQTVKFLIGGTATNGVDYQQIADSIIIPAGQTTASLSIIPFLDNNPEGTETVKISITEPCQNNIIDSVVLVIQDSLMTNVTGAVNICPYTTSSLNITGGLNYTWSPAATLNNPNIANPIASPLTTTIYTVNTTVGGCSAVDTFTVNVKPIPPVTAGPDTVLCFNAPVQLYSNAPTAVSRLWSPPVYLSQTNIANPVVNLPSGVTSINYIVTVTDNLGCKNRDTVSIVISPMTGATVSADTSICAGGSVTLIAGGGTSYRWRPATGLSDTTIAAPIATPAVTTTYTVRVSNAGGCYQDKTVKVTVNPIPTANAGPDKSICIGSSVTINGTANGAVSWNPSTNLNNPSSATPVFTPTLSGTATYTMTVTSAAGCTATDDVVITSTQLDFLTTAGDTTICGGIPVPITATGGVSYNWTPGNLLDNPSSATPNATIYGNTTFLVTATDANGCTDKDSVKVLLGAAGTISFAPKDTLICPGESVQLSASGGVSYSWSPAAGLSNPNIANPLATPVTSTDYVLTTTFANGCLKKDTINIIVEPVPIANAGADKVICNGTSVNLSASGGVNYSWSPATGLSNPNIQNPVVSPSATTTYTVTVSSAAGCSSTDDVTLTVSAAPIANAGADVAICNGNTTNLSATGNGTYSWSPATGMNNPNISNPAANPTATTIYTVTVTNADGCSSTDDVVVTVNSISGIQAGPYGSICSGDSLQLNSSGGINYSWSPASGLNDPNIKNPMAKPAATTTYTVTVTDANGCSGTASATVTVNIPQPVIAGTDQTICKGDTAQLSASGVQSYSWTPALSLNNTNIANPKASPDSTTVYYVTGTDMNGCTTNDSVLVEVVNAPVIVLSQNDTSICPGTSVTLGASGGSQFSWSPAASLDDASIAAPTATPTQTTTYNVVISDVNGCSSDTSITVTVFPITDPKAGPLGSRICEGDSIELFASDGVTYEWQPKNILSDPFIQNPVAKPAGNTVFTVTIFDMNGCEFTDSIEIEVAPAAMADAGKDTTIVIGTSALLNGQANGFVTWTPATGLNNTFIADPVASPVVTTVYIMEVETGDGCLAADSVEIKVKGASELLVPTAFSPNGDGINDVLILTEFNGLELRGFMIYNRWGQQVFATNNISVGWDGKFEGVDQEIGVYYFKVVAEGTKGEIIDKQGTITLIR